MNKVKVEESVSLGRLDAVKKTEAYSGFDWYADFPNHFAGDPTKATAEYGEYIFNILRDNLVSIIREIKKDNTSLVLIDEYNKLAK
jgi:creatinine amidohydrolase